MVQCYMKEIMLFGDERQMRVHVNNLPRVDLELER